MPMNDGPGATSNPENEASSSLRNRIGAGVVGAAFAFLAGAIILAPKIEEKQRADPDNTRQVAPTSTSSTGRFCARTS